MLIVARSEGESVRIETPSGEVVRIKVQRMEWRRPRRRDRVSLAIEADRSILITREGPCDAAVSPSV